MDDGGAGMRFVFGDRFWVSLFKNEADTRKLVAMFFTISFDGHYCPPVQARTFLANQVIINRWNLSDEGIRCSKFDFEQKTTEEKKELEGRSSLLIFRSRWKRSVLKT